jgi:hypothetical protein
LNTSLEEQRFLQLISAKGSVKIRWSSRDRLDGRSFCATWSHEFELAE